MKIIVFNIISVLCLKDILHLSLADFNSGHGLTPVNECLQEEKREEERRGEERRLAEFLRTKNTCEVTCVRGVNEVLCQVDQQALGHRSLVSVLSVSAHFYLMISPKYWLYRYQLPECLIYQKVKFLQKARNILQHSGLCTC
jgi:hypothetical protein